MPWHCHPSGHSTEQPGSEQIPASLLDPHPEKPRELVRYLSKLPNPQEKASSCTLLLFKIKDVVGLFFSQGRQPRELEILAGCERDATLSSSCREKNARCERVTPTVVLEGNLPAWRDGESKARRWKSAAGRCETGAEVTGCCRRGRELSGVWPCGKGCEGLVWRGICFCFKMFGNVLETGTCTAWFLLSPPRDQEAASCPCHQVATGRSCRR